MNSIAAKAWRWVVVLIAIAVLVVAYFQKNKAADVSSETLSAAELMAAYSYQNSEQCRAQFDKVLKLIDGAEVRKSLKQNPTYLDAKCFAVPQNKINTTDCFGPYDFNEADSPVQADGLCDLFLLYSKYALADFFYYDLSNLAGIPDQLLRAKATLQIISEEPNGPVLEKLADEIYRRGPDDLKSLKTYLKAQYVLGKDFSVTGALFPVVTRARTLASGDDEFQQFFAYSVVASTSLTDFPELSFLRDGSAEYFHAWFHWKNKTDIKKVMSSLKAGANQNTNYQSLYETTLQFVSDSNTTFGQENVFKLLLNPLPLWDDL